MKKQTSGLPLLPRALLYANLVKSVTCKRTVRENQIEKIILIFLKSSGLESRQSTQTHETNSESSMSPWKVNVTLR